jgi:hypothetical protein
MSPLMKQLIEGKMLRRDRLKSLPYPEKVRIVAQMLESLKCLKQSKKSDETSPIHRPKTP